MKTESISHMRGHSAQPTSQNNARDEDINAKAGSLVDLGIFNRINFDDFHNLYEVFRDYNYTQDPLFFWKRGNLIR